MKLKKLVAALALALPFAFGAAQAASVVMSFEDDDIDFLLTPVTVDGVTTLQPKLTGAFAPGDVLVSVFEIVNFAVGGADAIPAGMELTGIAAIQLAGGDGTVVSPFFFTPYSGGFNAISPVDVDGGNSGEGATIAMWMSSENFDINFTSNPAGSCTSLADCLGDASEGSLVQVDGFFGDDDEFWTSTLAIAGGANPGVVGGLAGDVLVASFQAAQTTYFNSLGPIAYRDIATGVECGGGTTAADGCIAGPVISGTILGGLGLNEGITDDGGFARSDLDASKLLAVPEPGTLALAGLSLLGLAAARRRRQK